MPILIKLTGKTRVAALVGTLAGWWRRASNLVPPTLMGSLVGGLSAVALWRWGYGKMDLLIFVFSLSGLALLGLGSFFTVAASLYLRRYVRRNPQLFRESLPILETGSPTETGFALPSLGRLPLVKIQWRMVTPQRVRCRRRWREGMLVEELVADRRCRVERVVREIETRDAFGLSRLAWRCEHKTSLTVLPHIGRLGAMPPVHSMSSSEGLPHPSGAPEGDRMEIRRYVPGDPVRHILWKVYARTRQLNVRVPERAVDRSQRMVAYLLTGPRDGAAAAAARVTLQNELLGPDWLFACDGLAVPTDDLAQALPAIAGSGNGVEGTSAEGLRRFLSRPEIADEKHCVIFAAGEPGPWVQEVLAATRAFAGTCSFILGTDGVIDTQDRSFWHRVLFYEPAEGERTKTTSVGLMELMTTLHGGGHPVMAADRKSGRSHGRLDLPTTGATTAMPLGRTG